MLKLNGLRTIEYFSDALLSPNAQLNQRRFPIRSGSKIDESENAKGAKVNRFIPKSEHYPMITILIMELKPDGGIEAARIRNDRS
jgi:hypothetical protein